jgi:hypothetical protein
MYRRYDGANLEIRVLEDAHPAPASTDAGTSPPP